MWFYRAIDEYGCYMAEAYRKEDLIEKCIDEFGEEMASTFIIVRVFDGKLN